MHVSVAISLKETLAKELISTGLCAVHHQLSLSSGHGVVRSKDRRQN